MESSIAVFLERQSACELLPTEFRFHRGGVRLSWRQTSFSDTFRVRFCVVVSVRNLLTKGMIFIGRCCDFCLSFNA